MKMAVIQSFYLQALEYIQITSTSLSKLTICTQEKDESSPRNGDIFDKRSKISDVRDINLTDSLESKCNQFDQLQHLDVRNNQLSQIRANGLMHLTDVYLSGNLKDDIC